MLLPLERFDRIAAAHGDAIAIEVPPSPSRPARRSVGYRELQRQSFQLAAQLQPCLLPSEPEPLVVLLFPREAPALYAAQLAVWRCGAAFSCLDPAFPDGHLEAVLAGAAAVVGDAAGCARLARLAPGLPCLDVDAVAGPDGEFRPAQPTAAALAYVIYTSGTTGAPKGVMIEHGALANLVAADSDTFRLSPAARVAQCSSPAYDSSLEESWLAFAAGATLLLLDAETVRGGPELAAWLRRERIGVLCPPPTLLRSLGCRDPELELPELELVYVGGEALPQDLADLWARGKWLENGYGPTECTVTCLRGRVRSGVPVTIGRPIAGCTAAVLEDGELYIGGACLARGYRDAPALTAERFLDHPQLGRLYRTGDLARLNSAGDYECLGRRDAQVKLRGYRIELEAVEAALAAQPGVHAAACRLQDGWLAAHVVPADSAAPPAPAALRTALRERLPGYMVPARIGLIAELPLSAGGKLDRRRLPDLAAPAGGAAAPPRSPREAAVVGAFAVALRLAEDAVAGEADFFLDLGGDSLAAVAAITALRDRGWQAGVRDLYEARNVSALAARIVPAAAAAPAPARTDARPFWFTVAQTAWLLVELLLAGALAWLGYDLVPRLFLHWPPSVALAATGAAVLIASLAWTPLALAWTLLLKRLLIGRYRPGRAPLWGGFHLRHWMVTRAARRVAWGRLESTVFAGWALRRLGARVGSRVYIHRGVDLARGGWDLLRIDDDVTLAQECALRLVEFEPGELVIGSIRLGQGATLETRAGMAPGTELGAGAWLGPLSCLPGGGSVPAGELWSGVPARPAGTAPLPPRLTHRSRLTPALHGAVVAATRLTGDLAFWAPWPVVALVTPPAATQRWLNWLDAPRLTWTAAGAATLLVVAGMIAALGLRALLARWLGRIAPGCYGLWSLESARLNAAIALTEAAGRWLAGTLAWPLWLRFAGMRIGERAEISTLLDIAPATLSLGDECFFADGVYIAPPRRGAGAVHVAPTRIGPHTFIGNHSVVPAGFAWPQGMFLGVATVPRPQDVRPDSAWFGNPALELPRRATPVDRRLAYQPGALRFITRVFWESLRPVTPALPLLLAAVWAGWVEAAAARHSAAAVAFVWSPLALLAALALQCGAVVVLKWMLLARARPGQHAFWSCWCGRWDFLYIAWENWGVPVLEQLEGTLLLNACLRLTGARLGRRVVLGRGYVQLVDPDLLEAGDDAVLTGHLQAHTFEDRLLKMDGIQIGAGAHFGDDAIALYGVRLDPGSCLAPHGVAMKYEHLAAGAIYTGCPAEARTAPADSMTLSLR